MKTRQQLAKGYVNCTLTKGEMRVAESSPLVMNEVNRLMKSKKTSMDKKEALDGQKTLFI